MIAVISRSHTSLWQITYRQHAKFLDPLVERFMHEAPADTMSFYQIAITAIVVFPINPEEYT